MSNQYLVKYSQRLDEAVYKIYGNLDLFEAVLKKNQHLLSKIFLEAGDHVNIVEIKSTKSSIKKEVNLKSIW